MEKTNYLKTWRLVSFLGLVGVLLMTSSCSDGAALPDYQNEDPLSMAKADFSDALSLWNAPENFELASEDTSNQETEEKLLHKRLILVQEDSKNLLLASGRTIEELNSLNPKEIFLSALKVYTKNNTNLKKQ